MLRPDEVSATEISRGKHSTGHSGAGGINLDRFDSCGVGFDFNYFFAADTRGLTRTVQLNADPLSCEITFLPDDQGERPQLNSSLFIIQFRFIIYEIHQRKFWDTHESIDYLDDFEDTKNVVFVRPKKQVISLRLESQVINKLKELADKESLRPTTLARMRIIRAIRNNAT